MQQGSPAFARDGLWQAALFVWIVSSRIPFLSAGYGSDPDAQRVIKAAHTIRETGRYAASRLPGYPVQEYAVAALLPGGVWAINGLSALMSGVCGVCFAGCLRAVGIRAATAFVLALGSVAVPVVYLNSTCAMDYVWALAGILAAALAAVRDRPRIAGICLGLAIGTRVTSGAMLLPLALLIAARSPSWSRAWRAQLAMTLVALPLAAACYVPVFQRYGASFFSHAPAHAAAPTLGLIQRATREVWGVVGCAALAIALVCATCLHSPARERSTHALRTWVSSACFCAIVLYSVAYALLPLEAGYLIPIVPFTVWLAAMWLTERQRWIFAVLLCLSPFVDHQQQRFRLHAALASDHAERVAIAHEAQQIMEAVARLTKPAVIVAGYRLPIIESLVGSQSTGAGRYIYLLKDAAQLAALRRDGFEVYVVDRATELYQARITGLRLRDKGVPRLPLVP